MICGKCRKEHNGNFKTCDKCREYNKEYIKEYIKEYRDNHKEQKKEYMKDYRDNHKEQIKEYRDNHKEQKKEYMKDYVKKRKQTDPMYKLIINTRRRVKQALQNNKSIHTNEYLQCSNKFLYKYIKSQLPEGITMDDLGKEYHIDHIIPIHFNDPTKEEIIFRLGWYNLQVLKAEDNLKKSNNEPTINEKIKLVNNLIKYNKILFSK